MTIIYHHGNLQNNSMSHQEHLEHGQKTVKLNILDPIIQEEEFTMLKMSNVSLELQKQTEIKKQSVMQELVPIIKKKTLKDKSNILKMPTQMQQSLKTLDPVLIGKDQDLCQFWNKFSQELSTKLWLPTETEFVDLDMNSWNGSSKKLMLKSWFSTKILQKQSSLENSQMIYLQSLQSSLPKIMELELESTKEKEKKKKIKNEKLKLEAGKSKLIRIYLTSDQKIKLKKWFGVRRWIYNKCLYLIKNNLAKATITDLREKVIKNKNYENENKWMLNYEFDLRDEAARDLLKNIDANKAKGKKFSMQFKSKKDKNDSISVLSKKWNKKNNFYSDIFNVSKISSSEKIPDKLDYTCRLKRTPTNKYFLCIPEPLKMESDNQASKGNMIFIDPGQKTFLTGYDPSGKIIIWGERDIGVIARLLHYKNKLQGRITKINNAKKRYTMKRALLRINEHIYNLVDELHKKLSKWLLENYQYVFIPKLNFHKCKNLNNKSKCKMASYRHCSFVDRLINKSREYKNSKVLIVNESYTSKTCSRCGNQHETLKNKDVYECNSCNLKISRDINASKNVMLRYFSQRVNLKH